MTVNNSTTTNKRKADDSGEKGDVAAETFLSPHNWIDNKASPIPSSSGKVTSVAVTNPMDGKNLCNVEFPSSPHSEVDRGVQSSHNAFLKWSQRTSKDRIQFLIRYHQLIVKNKEKIADLIVLEHGKTKEEALAEVAKGNETVEYALSLPQLIQGKTLEVSRGVTCRDWKKPLGVVVSIVPFNFPFMVPHWTLPIAIACGNSFILKPSEKVPLTMTFVMTLLKEAGLPDGVVNLINGTAQVVQELCDHPQVKAITFVGTSNVAEILSHRCRHLNKKVLALGGAKNHLVAAPDCNIGMASSDIVASFTGCAGQRCMAASVLLTIGKQEALVAMIVEKAKAIQAGQKGKDAMGPVIDKLSLDKIKKYIDEAEKGGAKILLDGRGWMKTHPNGYWIGPTVILHSKKTDSALHDEIFGPVISIFVCQTKEEAIEIENGNPYGNAACIYTSTGAVAEWFSSRFSAGMLGVNIGVPVPREPFSFGGVNKSKFGDFDITGEGALDFYTERIKVTTKWNKPEGGVADWMS